MTIYTKCISCEGLIKLDGFTNARSQRWQCLECLIRFSEYSRTCNFFSQEVKNNACMLGAKGFKDVYIAPLLGTNEVNIGRWRKKGCLLLNGNSFSDMVDIHQYTNNDSVINSLLMTDGCLYMLIELLGNKKDMLITHEGARMEGLRRVI